MLEIINSVLTKEAKAQVGDVIYAISYAVHNNCIMNISCTVSKNVIVNQDTPEGNQPIETQQHIGYIRRENERLYLDFDSSIDPIDFITTYKQLEREIDNDIEKYISE